MQHPVNKSIVITKPEDIVEKLSMMDLGIRNIGYDLVEIKNKLNEQQAVIKELLTAKKKKTKSTTGTTDGVVMNPDGTTSGVSDIIGNTPGVSQNKVSKPNIQQRIGACFKDPANVEFRKKLTTLSDITVSTWVVNNNVVNMTDKETLTKAFKYFWDGVKANDALKKEIDSLIGHVEGSQGGSQGGGQEQQPTPQVFQPLTTQGFQPLNHGQTVSQPLPGQFPGGFGVPVKQTQ